jgi:hypothetical protein
LLLPRLAVLADFLFLHGAPHPGSSILSFQVLQLQEVFRQDGFPLIQRLHLCFLLAN